MLFTIVTPSFNCGEFLPQNLKSVRDQGFGPDQLEQWVIDGGSTDGTVEMLKQQKDIQWVSEPDRGLSDAVNKGIQRSRGQWIIWLNADDLLAPDACRIFLEHAQRYPDKRIFCGDLAYLRADGSVEQTLKGWDYNLEELLGLRTSINQPATFAHREVYEKVGLIDVSIRYAMDYEWVVRAMHHYQCQPIPHLLAYSRRRAGSLTHAYMADHYRLFLQMRRRYRKPRFSKAELYLRFYLYTEPLRSILWLRRLVRRGKRLVGREPLHPI